MEGLEPFAQLSITTPYLSLSGFLSLAGILSISVSSAPHRTHTPAEGTESPGRRQGRTRHIGTEGATRGGRAGSLMEDKRYPEARAEQAKRRALVG